MKNNFSNHSLWLAGFRPFFVLALLFGALIPLLWVAVYSGLVALPPGINPLQWHAHEMLYGFGWAVLGGFLLTASKNWVNIRGIHGWPLIILATLWIIERVVIYIPLFNQSIFYWVVMNGFIVSTASYLLWSLIVHRKKDSFKDNFFFHILLVLFIIAKNLTLSENYFGHGVVMSIGLFRLAFAVMFERTMTQFMKTTEGVQLFRNPILDYGVKGFVLLSVFQSFFPSTVASLILGSASVLLLVRWLLWQPHRGFQKFGNGIMYLGSLGLILHFIAETGRSLNWNIGISFSLHIFTFLCMGTVISGMIVRISQGHTGRKPEFLGSDKLAISLIMVAAVFRLVLTSISPEKSILWISIAGVLWSLCFALLAIRLIPFLFQPRVDGKSY